MRFFREIPKYLKRVDGHLNSESIDRQFGKSDVCDNYIEILNRNRVPGSRAIGKDNARGGKGTRWKGQRVYNWDEGIANPGGSDNHHSQEEFGNEGGR